MASIRTQPLGSLPLLPLLPPLPYLVNPLPHLPLRQHTPSSLFGSLLFPPTTDIRVISSSPGVETTTPVLVTLRPTAPGPLSPGPQHTGPAIYQEPLAECLSRVQHERYMRRATGYNPGKLPVSVQTPPRHARINTISADIKQAKGQNASSGHLAARAMGGFHFFPSVSSDVSIMTT